MNAADELKALRERQNSIQARIEELEKQQAEEARDAEMKAKGYVQRTNLMSGKKFWEDPDTPYYCSPSSETYWSS